jgi:CDGSH-type Zn-finger protein
MEHKKDNEPGAHIEVIDRGPLKITGNIVFTDFKRGITITDSEIIICRCNKSANKPFCDGSHENKSFTKGSK